MFRPRTLCAVAIVALAVLTGCSDTDDSASSNKKDKQSGKPSVAQQHESNLMKALLKETDLPQEMAENKEDNSTTITETTNQECTDMFGGAEIKIGDYEVRREFTNESGVAFASNIVGEFKDAADAQAFIARFRNAAPNCSTWTEVDNEGTETIGHMTLASDAPKLGDDSASGTFVAEVGEMTANMSVSIVQKGKYVTGIAYGGLIQLDDKDTDALASAIAAKLETLA